MASFAEQRRAMVRRQIADRGVRDDAVLRAMAEVPREAFVPAELRPHAYEDRPLPIGSEQTISQPYVVAAMAEALQIEPTDRVLEIGAGSGYAAAVLGQISAAVYAIERIGDLAERAIERIDELGYDNIHIRHGDGSVGWPEAAPFDAIVVAAAGPEVPESLRRQLAVGGRLVIPVGPTMMAQRLVRLTRRDEETFDEEELDPVRFVPLIGEEGWPEDGGDRRSSRAERRERPVRELIARAAEPFAGVEPELDRLLDRIGDARLVLLGEATHGTSEFYRLRAHITRALIERRGFRTVAVEADWPDAARIDRWIRRQEERPADWRAFARFPTWMWRNRDVRDFVHWLRELNGAVTEADRVGFYGLDMYSLYTSMSSVLEYLDDADPEAARVARERYGCLEPFEPDAAAYGRATVTHGYQACEDEVVATLTDVLARRTESLELDGRRFLDAVQNARLVADAERYYRLMYYGNRQSWNLRDRHMYDTLQALRAFSGPATGVVVWEHNSHVGDARATEMGDRGELNVGQLCRERHGRGAFLVGFGTDRGTVAAASSWAGGMEVKAVRPSIEGSYERSCADSGVDRFLLPVGPAADEELRRRLAEPRLERAIGVIYRPETERASHYFRAELPHQFDEWIWVAESRAVTPLSAEEVAGTPDTYPFGM